MIELQKYLQGQIIDSRYPLIQYLGATGHSSVFLTEYADGRNQQAAIKLVPAPSGNSEAQLTRWRLAARFSHPSLLRIFRMGRCELDGRPMLYVVMEYAEENLSEVLPVRCLSPGETDAVLGPALDALGYLHSKGFVHGHVQPSNILAIGDRLLLSSDAIARIGETADHRDSRDPYSAPESELSTAGDIWSLGVTLVKCLTGRVPDRDPSGRHSVTVPADLPAPFLDLARHCLNPVPQRRWSVAQLKAALDRGFAPTASDPASDSVSTAAPPTSAFDKPALAAPVLRQAFVRKHYKVILAGLAAAAAAFVLGIVMSSNNSGTAVTASAPVTSSAGQAQAGVASPKAHPAAPVQPQRAENPRTAVRETPKLAAHPQPRAPSADSVAKPPASSPAQFARSEAALPAEEQPPAAPAGDSAQPSSPVNSDLVPGAVAHRALPNVPSSASNTIWGTVRVSVVVDVAPSGRVVDAKFDAAGPSRYFARLSMAAAQDWKFAPPRVDGRIVPSEWVINFGYSKTDTSATALEKHP
jgi:serine/threonine protein kinase